LAPNFPEPVSRIIRALDGKKALNISILDVRRIVSYTDWMVVCSGSSGTHVQALVSSVREAFAKGEGPLYVNPSDDDSWWILDFVEVVVHVFKDEVRVFYDLERLWGDADRVSPAAHE
jgi:ribosome-associated protein